MRLSPLLLVLLSACSQQAKIPCGLEQPVAGFPDASYDVTECSGPWSAFDVGLGLHVFLSSWEATFGPNNDVDWAVRNVEVTCREKDWLSAYWDIDVSGITLPGNIHVALRSKEYGFCRSLPASSFVHELVHVSLEACCGNGDADHADGTDYGDTWKASHDTFIAETNRFLMELLDIPPEEETFDPSDGRCYEACVPPPVP